MDFMRAQFVGKDVQVYPNDTYKKIAKVIDINPAGVTFLVTESEDSKGWPVNSIKFVAFSASLNFTLAQ